MDFIESIAQSVQKYAGKYGIKVHSPIIAQAILESAKGTSELAMNAHNYFGLKYKPSVSEKEPYYKVGSEQNADGSYTSSAMQWCNFSSMDSGVEGYFKFISASRYANLKGVTDPETYLNHIKSDGYATSFKYVENLMNVIRKYDLTKYDTDTHVDDTASPTKYFRVQVGAFSAYKNAEQCKKQLENAGYQCVIVQDGSLYKCQTGAFQSKSNAENLFLRVQNSGFKAFITYN